MRNQRQAHCPQCGLTLAVKNEPPSMAKWANSQMTVDDEQDFGA